MSFTSSNTLNSVAQLTDDLK